MWRRGKPALATARDGVRYIGIAFRRAEDTEQGKAPVVLAQMFLNTGRYL